MSELKAINIPLGKEDWYYPKSEADKVIAEKDAEIVKLKADYKEACDRLQTAGLIKDEQKAKADRTHQDAARLDLKKNNRL